MKSFNSKLVNLIVLVTLLAVWFVTPLPVHAAKTHVFGTKFSPDGKQLAFLSNRDGDWKLMAANADGSNLRVLLDDIVSQNSTFAWANDSSYIIASDGNDEFSALYRVSFLPDGIKGADRLTAGYSPDIAPDGLVVFTVGKAGKSYISTMTVEGTAIRNVQVLTTGGFGVFSPDGAYIAYMDTLDVADSSSSYLQMMQRDGSHKRLLAPGDSYPSWSPDGKYLAFIKMKNHQQTQLFVMGIDDQEEPYRLDQGDDEYTSPPVWSPEGNWLLFFQYESAMDISGDIYIQRPGTSSPRRITTYPGVDHSPVWTPDGKQVVFSSDREEPATLFVMDTAGENVKSFLKK